MQFMKTLTAAEQELCKNAKGLFDILSEKFNPQRKETILYLQYCKVKRNSDESEEELIGRLRLKAIECKYKDIQKINKTIHKWHE